MYYVYTIPEHILISKFLNNQIYYDIQQIRYKCKWDAAKVNLQWQIKMCTCKHNYHIMACAKTSNIGKMIQQLQAFCNALDVIEGFCNIKNSWFTGNGLQINQLRLRIETL